MHKRILNLFPDVPYDIGIRLLLERLESSEASQVQAIDQLGNAMLKISLLEFRFGPANHGG